MDLWNEPWIPTAGDHPTKDVSIVEALTGNWTRIHCGFPITDSSIMRMLAAILLDAYRGHIDEWDEAVYDGVVHDDIITAYGTAYGDRFHLSHPQYPFMQHPELRPYLDPQDDTTPWSFAWSPVKNFDWRISSGNDRLFYDHTRADTMIPFTPARMARTLITVMAAQMPGVIPGQGNPFNPTKPNSTTRAAKPTPLFSTRQYFVCTGSIGQDLITMLRSLDPDDVHHAEDDVPFWRQDIPLAPRLRGINGPRDWLTWPSRRALLREPQDGLYHGAYIAPGDGFTAKPTQLDDPFIAWNSKTRSPAAGTRAQAACEGGPLAFTRRAEPKDGIVPPVAITNLLQWSKHPVTVRHISQLGEQGKYLLQQDDTFVLHPEDDPDGFRERVNWIAEIAPSYDIARLSLWKCISAMTHTDGPLDISVIDTALEHLSAPIKLRILYTDHFAQKVNDPDLDEVDLEFAFDDTPTLF